MTNMEDLTNREDMWCRMFLKSMEGDAIGCYKELPNGRFHNFKELKRKFCEAQYKRLARIHISENVN